MKTYRNTCAESDVVSMCFVVKKNWNLQIVQVPDVAITLWHVIPITKTLHMSKEKKN